MKSPLLQSNFGFSLSPGGLLLPYHLGVLDCLQRHNWLTPLTPLAGSSAGAIATAAHASGLDSQIVLQRITQISQQCHDLGGARGRLLFLLRAALHEVVQDKHVATLQQRPGLTGIAYRQVFPQSRKILQTKFASKHDLIDAVCFSSMFPFFASNLPCVIDWHKAYPRLFVDGYFTVPRSRFGCPDFAMAEHDGDDTDNDVARNMRTIAVSVFPRNLIRLDDFHEHDCICPRTWIGNEKEQLRYLFRFATQATSEAELRQVYDNGWQDAARWMQLQESLRPAAGGYDLNASSLELN